MKPKKSTNKAAPAKKGSLKLKTVHSMGMKLTFHPSAENEKLTQKLLSGVKKARAKRRALAAKKAITPPPDLVPNECLVAFIDILGFGATIKRARSEDALRQAHEKITTVQKLFQKVEVSDDPDEQRQMNENFGRRVIALSDAVVVVFSRQAPARSIMGGYDHFGSAISELILAQTQLILNHGIFVRGGISIGSFYFENDVLLSPAVAQAYELESKHAEYPVIALTDETRRKLLDEPDKAVYAPDADLAPKAFRRHGKRRANGQAVYYLDYLRSFDGNTDHFSTREEWLAWLEAKKKRDDAKVRQIEETGWLNSLAAMRRRHRELIQAAYRSTNNERVRSKYRWLMRYHNQAFATTHEVLAKELIHLPDFERTEVDGSM